MDGRRRGGECNRPDNTSDSEEMKSMESTSKAVMFYYGPYIWEKEIHMKMCSEMPTVLVCFSNIEKILLKF